MLADKWFKFHQRTDPGYEIFVNFPMIQGFVKEIMDRAKPGDKLLEIGFGTGYTAIYLAKQGYDVNAIDISSKLVVKAAAEALRRDVSVMFWGGDMFDMPLSMFKDIGRKFKVIYHQGVLEHYSDEDIVKALKLQFPLCEYLIFSVPSDHYSTQDFGDERFLTIDQWKEILKDFEVVNSYYYGPKDYFLTITLKGGLYAGDGRRKGEKAKRTIGSVESDSKED